MRCVEAVRRGSVSAWLALAALAPTADAAPAHSVLQPAGPAAAAIAEIGWVMFVGASLILVLVMALLWFALRRPAAPVRRGLWLVGAGIVFPVAVLSALAVYSQWRSTGVRAEPPADALVISLTGRLWWWEVRYRDPAGGPDIVLANEIRIPVGRTVHLGLTSADVIHSAWIPSLAGKMDLVPGRVNRLVFSADKAGIYRGQCAEFCGEQHARMALHVVAQPPDEFAAWLAAQARPAAAPASPEQVRGRDAFLAQRCNACHSVRGLSEEGRLAPDLTHIGSRLALGAGTLDNTDQGAAMARWIAHVQQLKPGAQMPSYDRLDGPTLNAIAAYLAHLQ